MRTWIESSRSIKATLLAGLATISLAGCGGGMSMGDIPGSTRPAKSEFSGVYPHDYPIHGIDVSKYQGDIDWPRVKSSGLQFAYIKATEGGDHVDEKFQANWNGAKSAGIPRGAYHFVYWCRPWREEMEAYERTVPAEPDALPPVLDVEATPTSRTCPRQLVREEVVGEIREMLREMERHYGKRPVIYTTVDFYQGILHPSELEEYPIWVRSTKYSPHVKYGARKWHFWHFQSDAEIPGINGKVDRNVFAGDWSQWKAFINPEVRVADR